MNKENVNPSIYDVTKVEDTLNQELNEASMEKAQSQGEAGGSFDTPRSSNIVSVSWSSDDLTLVVQFKTRRYEFLNVPSGVYYEMKHVYESGGSIGKNFNTLVKGGNYPYSQI